MATKIQVYDTTDKKALQELLMATLHYQAVLDGFDFGWIHTKLGDELHDVLYVLRERIKFIDLSSPIDAARYPKIVERRRRRLADLRSLMEHHLLPSENVRELMALEAWEQSEAAVEKFDETV